MADETVDQVFARPIIFACIERRKTLTLVNVDLAVRALPACSALTRVCVDGLLRADAGIEAWCGRTLLDVIGTRVAFPPSRTDASKRSYPIDALPEILTRVWAAFVNIDFTRVAAVSRSTRARKSVCLDAFSCA